MFVLKITHRTYMNGQVFDEFSVFKEADEVIVHSVVKDQEKELSAWQTDDYKDYTDTIKTESESGNVGNTRSAEGRLVQIIKNDKSDWYLITHAWIMGSDGKTIERIVV